MKNGRKFISLSEGRRGATIFSFLVHRARRDLQFSNIFYVEFFAAAAYAGATIYLLRSAEATLTAAIACSALVTFFALLHVAKIYSIVELEQRGGDAREFVGSERLVTTGVYAYSRNPVYLISIVQSLVWSILLIFLSATHPHAWIGYALAPTLLYAHYWGIDRLIIPFEEEALRHKHPQEFAAYCTRVRRWLGRKD